VAFYAGHGITVWRVLSDNGGCHRSKLFAAAAERLGIGLRKTRPYRPQTNGKAERFICTLLAEWAYALLFHDSSARAAALPAFVDFYGSKSSGLPGGGWSEQNRCGAGDRRTEEQGRG
jgi:transposase InsO family protein